MFISIYLSIDQLHASIIHLLRSKPKFVSLLVFIMIYFQKRCVFVDQSDAKQYTKI